MKNQILNQIAEELKIYIITDYIELNEVEKQVVFSLVGMIINNSYSKNETIEDAVAWEIDTVIKNWIATENLTALEADTVIRVLLS